MAAKYKIPLWKQAPFVRLVAPFVAGVIFQFYIHIPIFFTMAGTAILVLLFSLFRFFPIAYKYKFQWLQGLMINLIIFFAALFITWQKDIRNNANWFGNYYTDSSTLVVKINEPPVEKEKSFKAEGKVESIITNDKVEKVTGKLLIYFSKNDKVSIPKYGDKILIKGGLQQIKNAGNPGGFNYSRYMMFQQTFHQVFLKNEKFILLNSHDENPLYSFVFFARENTIKILQKYIVGSKKVTGIAEALLIGYKEDLDKDVVQAYSNTGVVHIIAISGMHLGLIYIGLVWLFSKLPFIKRSAVTRVILIVSCLWIFSLITGASASVLRSAVMFTCIIIGKEFFKQASIYNSLASSAFLLLCFNPFLLWNVGFQLSYFAVGGIVWLQKPIENLFYSKHKGVQYLWQMCSITIAAQILTLPICIYYFHQIPTLFLFTNLICVPLSTLILFAEIFLIIISVIPFVASLVGKFIYVLTWLMNTIIDFFNNLPLSLIDKIYSTATTTSFLYVFVFLMAAGLIRRKKQLIKIALFSFVVFSAIWAYGKINLVKQKKIIIYNVSRHTAVDFVTANKYWFYGDDDFRKEGALQNFNLKPTRVSLQIEESIDTLPALKKSKFVWQFYNKNIMVVDTALKFESINNKTFVDVLLVTKNPFIHISDITCAVTPSYIVFDASNSLWKITQWKKECEDLHLPYFITGEQGAFILDAK
ncbi:MAG: ComEC family competence protein [Ferruginibacter sp.]|nr:ComEC family competence protein [Ferruginibacter sp.]